MYFEEKKKHYGSKAAAILGGVGAMASLAAYATLTGEPKTDAETAL